MPRCSSAAGAPALPRRGPCARRSSRRVELGLQRLQRSASAAAGLVGRLADLALEPTVLAPPTRLDRHAPVDWAVVLQLGDAAAQPVELALALGDAARRRSSRVARGVDRLLGRLVARDLGLGERVLADRRCRASAARSSWSPPAARPRAWPRARAACRPRRSDPRARTALRRSRSASTVLSAMRSVLSSAVTAAVWAAAAWSSSPGPPRSARRLGQQRVEAPVLLVEAETWAFRRPIALLQLVALGLELRHVAAACCSFSRAQLLDHLVLRDQADPPLLEHALLLVDDLAQVLDLGELLVELPPALVLGARQLRRAGAPCPAISRLSWPMSSWRGRAGARARRPGRPARTRWARAPASCPWPGAAPRAARRRRGCAPRPPPRARPARGAARRCDPCG